MKLFNTLTGNAFIPAQDFAFSGGERHLRLPLYEVFDSAVVRIQSSDDVMRLALLADIVDPTKVDLVIPYLPYARQDRRCTPGEAHSLRVFAKILNVLKFHSVKVYDPHSIVAEALIDNLVVVPQDDVIALNKNLVEFIGAPSTVLVSPDAGALKKIYAVGKRFNNSRIVCADKERNLRTGEIIRMTVNDPYGSLVGKNALIIDDICDGGRTFIELANVLKENGASSVELYVTHGIFSKTLAALNGAVSRVWTTDTFLPRTDNLVCTFDFTYAVHPVVSV